LFPAERAADKVRCANGVNLLGIEPEIEVAVIAFGHRFRSIRSGTGIWHGLPAERAIEDQFYILRLEVITVSGHQVESEETETEERFAGDPGDLAIELLLSHVLLLPA
jgi:hypothetical protein